MESLINKVKHYRRNYSIVARAHYISADRYGHINMLLGVPALTISIAICSTLFASSTPNFPQYILTAAGVASLFVTMLTGLQVFMRASERSMEHRAAGARFADVRRRLELMEIRFHNANNDSVKVCISELENMLIELRELGSLCPKIPDKDYKSAKKEYIAENESN